MGKKYKPLPYVLVSKNTLTQWLIGVFIRLSGSENNLINCAGVGRRTLFKLCEFFPTPKSVKKQADADLLLELYTSISQENPLVWYPGIIGFGETEYRLDSGRTGLTSRLAFAPRQTKFCLYFDPNFLEEQASLFQSLGKYKTGKGCVYINKLADIDLDVLQELLKRSL